jgi:hypothetical protein
VSTVTEQFQPSATPNGYDFRGNKTEDFVPADQAVPVAGEVLDAPVTPAADPAPREVHVVASEAEGYKAPGGLTRSEIRNRIRKVRPYSSVEVVVPEWDVVVEVRSLSLGARNDIAMAMVERDGVKPDRKNFYPNVIIACTYDSEGEKVWGDEDLAWVNSLDAHILDKIAEPAMKINGFTDDKAEEEAGKSSETATSESAS